MGLKVIGIDVSETQLEEARRCGADYTFNPVADKDYVEKILKLTGGGVKAAVNFTAAKAVSDSKSISLYNLLTMSVPSRTIACLQ
jgi:Zn-dependent alcohol dehydrogenase